MLQIGPLNIKVIWLIVGGGLMTGYLLLAFGSIFKGGDWKKLRETVSNSLFVFIISYLFGTIVFKFSTFISDPLSVLSYPSGQNELFLATGLFVVYLIYSSRANHTSLLTYLHAIMHILLPVTIIYAFFQQKVGIEVGILANILPWNTHPISLYTIILGGVLLLFLLNKKQNEYGLLIYLLWTGGMSGIQALNMSTEFFGIPVTQIYYLFLLIIGIGAWIHFKVLEK